MHEYIHTYTPYTTRVVTQTILPPKCPLAKAGESLRNPIRICWILNKKAGEQFPQNSEIKLHCVTTCVVYAIGMYVCMYVCNRVCVCICVDACKCVHICRYIASRSASGRRQPQRLRPHTASRSASGRRQLAVAPPAAHG